MYSAESSGRFYFSVDGSGNKFTSWGKRIDVDVPELEGIGAQRYSYGELHKATKGFSCLTGVGVSYKVYKGMVNGQQPVAIKVSSKNIDSHGRDIFLREIKVRSRLRHRNVVQFLGWCYEAGRMAIIYEILPNLNLHEHLHKSSRNPPLPWQVRYWKVAIGLASALLYLHEETEPRVLHRDINSRNVFLDYDFNPKLGDFGLSMDSECDITKIAGTLGYLDPECLIAGQRSKKSDIYGFGIVALEIATGRKAYKYIHIRLPEWIENLHGEGRLLEAADPKLENEFDRREMERLLLVGLRCTDPSSVERPSAKLILQLLNFEAQMPTDFAGNVGETTTDGSTGTLDDATNCEVMSHDYDQAQPSPGDDDDATTASLEANDVEDLSSVSGDDDEENEAALVPISELDVFDIGIPLDFPSGNRRKDHHRNIVMGFVHSLHELMQSMESRPRFEEALEEIRKYTGSLVAIVGPPLDDWNTLAQLVLRSLKEREDFIKSREDQESIAHSATMSSLNTEIQESVSTIKEDEQKLENAKESLALALQKYLDLAAELAKAKELSHSIEAEMKVIEQRIAGNLTSLAQRRKYHAILKQYENVLSMLSSFTL